MRHVLAALFLLASAIAPQTGSEIPNVKVEKISVTERSDPDNPVHLISLLVRNDTKLTIKVFEVRICYVNGGCGQAYLGGRFVPKAASWSNDYPVKASHFIASVTLTKIQSIEE